jgi:hypothetical protein
MGGCLLFSVRVHVCLCVCVTTDEPCGALFPRVQSIPQHRLPSWPFRLVLIVSFAE